MFFFGVCVDAVKCVAMNYGVYLWAGFSLCGLLLLLLALYALYPYLQQQKRAGMMESSKNDVKSKGDKNDG